MNIWAIKETRMEKFGEPKHIQYVSFTNYSTAYKWMNKHYKNLVYVQSENMYGTIFDYWYLKDCFHQYTFFEIVRMVVNEPIYMGDKELLENE